MNKTQEVNISGESEVSIYDHTVPFDEWEQSPKKRDFSERAVVTYDLTTIPIEFPKEYKVQTLLDDRLRLSTPILITVEKEGDHYLAVSHQIPNLFGMGEDPIAAIDDFRLSLAELYFELIEGEDSIGSGLLEESKLLKTLIQKI